MQTPTAAELACRFHLSSPPESFYDDPYPTYRALSEHDPVRVLGSHASLGSSRAMRPPATGGSASAGSRRCLRALATEMQQRTLQAWRASVVLAVTVGLDLFSAPVALPTPRIQPDAPPWCRYRRLRASRSRRPSSPAERRSRCRPAVRPAALMPTGV
jgi:hypothetical protein